MTLWMSIIWYSGCITWCAHAGPEWAAGCGRERDEGGEKEEIGVRGKPGQHHRPAGRSTLYITRSHTPLTLSHTHSHSHKLTHTHTYTHTHSHLLLYTHINSNNMYNKHHIVHIHHSCIYMHVCTCTHTTCPYYKNHTIIIRVYTCTPNIIHNRTLYTHTHTHTHLPHGLVQVKGALEAQVMGLDQQLQDSQQLCKSLREEKVRKSLLLLLPQFLCIHLHPYELGTYTVTPHIFPSL